MKRKEYYMSVFVQLLTRSLETGSIYALMALGIIIIFRTSYLVHFAQGTMGMFCTYMVTVFLKTMSFIPSVFCGVLSAVVLGMLVDVLIIRRANGVSHTGKQIITFGLVMIFLGIAPTIFGVDPITMPQFINSGDLNILGATISYNGLFNIAFVLVVMLVLFYILQKTKFGLAIRATSANEATARIFGIKTKNVTMFSWALGGVLGCLVGVMIAPSSAVTTFVLDSVFNAACIACIFGGFQTFVGPVIGAYLLGVLKNLTVYYVSSVWGEQIVYVLILLFIVVRPNGLIGKKLVKKV